MVVEVVELDSGRPLAELAARLEAQGGALVVLQWRRGNSATANVILPDDGARQATCRRLVEEWLAAGAEPEASVAGDAWPLGHPRHKFALSIG